MSPPHTSEGRESRPSTVPGNRPPSKVDDGIVAPAKEASVVDGLGEALAGVSLVSQSSSQLGPSMFAAGALVNTSQPSSGWGSFSEAGVHGSSVFTSGAVSGSMHTRNESIQRFLSQDPSQSLGEDVFKLSHPNLPHLSYEDTAATATPTSNGSTNVGAAFAYPGQSLGIGGNQSKHSFVGEIRPSLEITRRRTDSPSGTGTTASSRSASPYNTNNNNSNHNNDVANAGRMIPSYQPYEPVSDVSRSFTHSSFAEEERNASFGSQYHDSHPNLVSLDSRSSFGKERTTGGSNGNIKSYEQQLFASQQTDDAGQQQQQVLYMAVPSPDGRGQVLQPVQMVQLPGKPFTYVIPGVAAGLPQPNAFFQPEPSSSPMMVLPSLPSSGDLVGAGIQGGAGASARANSYTTDTVRAYETGTDDYTRGASGVFPTDSTLPINFGNQQRPPLDALLGQVRRLSRDQVGCRLVQQALDEEGPMAATLILNEGLPFWGEAMVDPFGNYLFQKILEKVTREERIMLVRSVSSRLVNASLNLHGTRSVQKVVELCALDEQEYPSDTGLEESAATILTSALAPAAARLCIDSHGNHVIQRILLKLGPRHSRFIFDAVANSVGDVARHRHGCCVIQRCLDSPTNEARSHLVNRIVDKSLELMQDAYGNYVVQYVLDVCSDEDVHAVCESVVGKVNLLAIQKFSSNVMEKCLERCSDRVKEMYLDEMSDPDRIRELMMDPFGNYVVQRALSVATHVQAVRLVEAMRPHLIATQTGSGQRNGGVRNTAGGRRIIAKICRRFPNFTLNPVGSPDDLYSQNKVVQRPQHFHPQQPQQHQPPLPNSIMQPYPVGASDPMHSFGDPRYQPQPPIQQPQQPFYGLNGNGGYYDHFTSSHGGYTGM